MKNRKMIGQILIEQGYINLSKLNEARRMQLLTEPDKRPLLGEALMQLGYVTTEQVEEALKLQEGHSAMSPSVPNPSL